jgi:hypothetical protein
VTTHTAHLAVAPVLTALAQLAAYEPTGPVDLADVLKDLHGHAIPNLVDGLVDVLWQLADRTRDAAARDVLDPARAETVAEHLCQFAADLSARACDHLDRAREATGHYAGSADTNREA